MYQTNYIWKKFFAIPHQIELRRPIILSICKFQNVDISSNFA